MTPKKILHDAADQEVSAIFKQMLFILEDMKQDHDFHYNKLYEEIPEEYHGIINAANHFTPQKVAWIRKKILDCGNDSRRNLQRELENFSVSFIFKQQD